MYCMIWYQINMFGTMHGSLVNGNVVTNLLFCFSTIFGTIHSYPDERKCSHSRGDVI